MRPERFRLLLIALAVVGLGGCQYFPHLSHWASLGHWPKVKVQPVPADTPQRTPLEARDALYERAVAAIDQRDYGLALDVLQVAREGQPNDPRVLTAMGVVYDKLGRFDLSKRYYDLAEAADPGSKVVALDRAYSAVLQQRTTAPTLQPLVLAETPTVTRLAVELPSAAPTIATARAAGIILTGHPVRVFNASGDTRFADAVQTHLARQGWSLVRVGTQASYRIAASRLQYPPSDQAAADALAHSLSFPVALDSCQSCKRVELVIGLDALSFAGQRPRG